jgi:glutaryl-CoA dehydrogenase
VTASAQELIRDSRLHVYPGGHLGLLTEAAGLAPVVDGFLAAENHVGRFVADSEAIYSYEGTREINTLVVGRAITGLSAFV